MHGVELEAMAARTQWQERERAIQQHLLEREVSKARAKRNIQLPHTGIVQRSLRAIAWCAKGVAALWPARRELSKA